jgi:glycerol-3-phosphate dehydrogenase (NAD(P)+)
MNNDARIGVVGGGSWGTALVKILNSNNDHLNWWIRKKENLEYIQQFHHNPNYLRYIKFNTSKLNLSTDLNKVIKNSDILVFAIPAAFLKDTLEQENIRDLKSKVIISAIKGIVPESYDTVGKFFRDAYNVDEKNLGMIAGPCHSEELAMEKLSYLTLAFNDPEKASFIERKLTKPYLRISKTRDLNGTEYSAVIKNIIAIANGICIGLGYGDNFQSVLIVNAIQELERFLNKINSSERNINESVYTGDLIVTAYSNFSRNRMFGNMIGKGYSVKAARIEMKMVAEGYYAVIGIKSIKDELKVEMPITESVYNILHKGSSPSLEMKKLAEKLS